MDDTFKCLNCFTDLWDAIVIMESKYEIAGVKVLTDGVCPAVYLYCDMAPKKVIALRDSLYTEGTPQMFDLHSLPSHTAESCTSVFDIDKLHEAKAYEASKDIYNQELHKLWLSFDTMQLHFDEQSRPIKILWLARMLELYPLLSSEKKGIDFTGELKTRNMTVSEECVYQYFDSEDATTIAAIFLCRSAITRGDIEYDRHINRAWDLLAMCGLKDKLLNFEYERIK